ncbi:methylated-DNA-(protein)-cysteine S-methyltransferase [Verrucomicrobiia bacterium DG1235]|nr:methylated-DNA-(protein)-cysteine S-methyltransferase [Verrucomicrobiae bacterium DG1235]
MYQAFVNKDASFEGLFVMGVRTTGIFCRPTCPARKPKPENVEFFPRSGDALAAGYRACKRCRPMEAKGSIPSWLRPLLAQVDAAPTRRWTSQDIRDAGLDPARVRRWFQAEHGMTFLAYLRSRRLGEAFSRVKDGSPILEAAAAADFDSVSGFCEALRKRSGASPSKAKERLPLKVQQVSSPLGPIMVAGDDQAVYLVEFWDRRMLETQFTTLEKRLNAVFFPGKSKASQQMADELDAYFQGETTTFETPIKFPGTEHQQAVWQTLLSVPSGETWTYGQLANSIGKPAAVRSVARAVGENRFAIVIPCHRIVGSDGNLTGYGGGLWRKRHLLEFERQKNFSS